MTSTRPFGHLNSKSAVPAHEARQRASLLPEPAPDPEIDRRASRRLLFDWLRYAGYGALVVAGLAGLRSINEGPSGQTAAAVATLPSTAVLAPTCTSCFRTTG